MNTLSETPREGTISFGDRRRSRNPVALRPTATSIRASRSEPDVQSNSTLVNTALEALAVWRRYEDHHGVDALISNLLVSQSTKHEATSSREHSFPLAFSTPPSLSRQVGHFTLSTCSLLYGRPSSGLNELHLLARLTPYRHCTKLLGFLRLYCTVRLGLLAFIQLPCSFCSDPREPEKIPAWREPGQNISSSKGLHLH